MAVLAANEPELLDGWLHQIGRQTLGDFLRGQESSRRSAWYSRAKGRAFKAAADHFEETGDPSAFSLLERSFVVAKDNTRRHLREMDRKDHFFVADAYARSSTRDALLSAFHRAIGNKVGDRRTGDVFTEETLTRLYQSIVGTTPDN